MTATGVPARDVVEAGVRRELFGPAPGEEPIGLAVDCSNLALVFPAREDSEGQFHDRDTREEVLTRSDPLRRYGIGVLHSGGASSTSSDGEEPLIIANLAESEDSPEEPSEESRRRGKYDEPDSDDFDLSDANRRKPSAMAISFKVRVPGSGQLDIKVTGAYYDPVNVTVPDFEMTWWVRRPFEIRGIATPDDLFKNKQQVKLQMVAVDLEGKLAPRIIPSVTLYCRPVPREDDAELRLVTLAIVNNVPGTGARNAFFQLAADAEGSGGLHIEPYPDVEQPDSDEEEESIALLYRHQRTFAIGHGCAADWGDIQDQESGIPIAYSVSAVAIPAYEVRSLTPDVFENDADGNRRSVSVSMKALADDTSEGREQVEKVLTLYASWIKQQRNLIDGLPERYRGAAGRHMDLCSSALKRMESGWQLAQTDAQAGRAFRLANSAMFDQQLRSRLPLRKLERDAQDVYRPVGPHPTPVAGEKSGRWRAFQIGFILASLPEIAQRENPNRKLVDLIFFPTGGGKTEAYLGAAAISILLRRLRDKNDTGTEVLMRYTLRLLTTQQFLRAASLVCVLEQIRDENVDELGTTEFGIGIWLGGESTPNTWKNAVRSLRELQREFNAPNKFLLLKCPWCGAKMGPVRRSSGQDTPGYYQSSDSVVLRCVDGECKFGRRRRPLPVHIVDEDIYDKRPSIIIGTVDKFATLAWRPEAHPLFGLGPSGERLFSPPGLIIQDELHLISGPLGSMVALYEPVIEELCTDDRDGKSIPPKIIASTATARRYEEQIRALFGREDVALFPPHGLEEGHSFFAEPALKDNGEPAPGRRYIGIMSSSLGSTQTLQVRVAAATLQSVENIDEISGRDGYWTNLNFLNSLRELGNTVTLLESDIPDYLVGLARRDGVTPRYPSNRLELTSRRRNDEIPKAIEDLEISLPSSKCIDVCLASNIIEVGVDIERLGLMTIIGQPKTTAQYIQVSGRVGRSANSPGLVLTIYGAMKPRDRSHYERFRTYHQRLYAQVEPTSLTPFAEPVLRRALHAAAIARMRQLDPGLAPYPFPRERFRDAVARLRERAMFVDEDELAIFDEVVEERDREWAVGERTAWAATKYFGGDPQNGLMRPAGDLPDPDAKTIIWDTPQSMRSVDAECRLQVSLAYLPDNIAAVGRTE